MTKKKASGSKSASKTGRKQQPKEKAGHKAPGVTVEGTREAGLPPFAAGGLKQVKAVEFDGDPTLAARPELTEHGRTAKEAPARNVQETVDDMQRQMVGRGATNYVQGTGERSAADKARRGEVVPREVLQAKRPAPAESEPATQPEPQKLADQEK